MATQGSLIRASDFNELQNMLSRILGDTITSYPNDPVAGTYGYGQGVIGSTVASGVDLVEAVQIAKLKSDVLKVATHCGLQTDPTVVALPTVTSGSIILASDFTTYKNCLDLLTAQRFALGTGQYSDEAVNPNLTNTRITPWGNNLNYHNAPEIVRHSFTLDFGSPQNARYFFNAGSSLRMSASRFGGTSSKQNHWWSAILGRVGTVVFNHNSTISTRGHGTGTSIGFYQLTNVAQQIYTSMPPINASYYYNFPNYSHYYEHPQGHNKYYITASCDIANNSNGGARYVYVNIYFVDSHTQYAPHAYLYDWVDGTLTSNVAIRRASGINVEVAAPTGINTRLLSSN